MSQKIQLKIKPIDNSTTKKGTPRDNSTTKKGTPRLKEIDRTKQIALFREILDQLDNITYDGEKYITKNKLLSNEHNLQLIKKYITPIKEISFYMGLEAVFKRDNPVASFVRIICKNFKVKTETFTVNNTTNLFIYLDS